MVTYYWLFTRHKVESSSIDGDDIVYTCTPEYNFFGYTSDKKILKEFKEIRDMDKFVVIKETLTSDEEVYFINNNRSISNKKLDIFEFRTKGGKSVEIVSTEDEYESCDTSENMGIFEELIDCTYSVSANLFQKEYRDALVTIGYEMFHRFSIGEDELEMAVENDELNTLLGMHGELFKPRGGN